MLDSLQRWWRWKSPWARRAARRRIAEGRPLYVDLYRPVIKTTGFTTGFTIEGHAEADGKPSNR